MAFKGLQNRETWFEDWNEYMSQPLEVFQPQKDQILCLQEIEDIEHISQKISLQTPQQTLFQKEVGLWVGNMETAFQISS